MKFALAQNPLFKKHRAPTSHVERPERLESIEKSLASNTFVCPLEEFPTRPGTDEEILLCHDPVVIERVKETTAAGGGHLDGDTFCNEFSEEAARLAVGTAVDLCRAVLKGEYDRGFLLARPPGHHATPSQSMGFCFFSTAAIAAKACKSLAERVLVFDWDVHHGNGTQDCLYDYGGTKFISFHQSHFYPGTGYADERGSGDGKGNIYNVPLPAGCGNAEYFEAYQKIVRPVIKQYDPQLIIVSAGYDAHENDLLGGMGVTAAGFGQMAAWVAEDASECSAQGKIVGLLEGGYHLGGLADSFIETIKSWTEERELKVKTPNCEDVVLRYLNRLSDDFGLT